ncbi:unnamed protein product [Effrenium voratum]|nr:unnamed protein product [Effrenium voratum]
MRVLIDMDKDHKSAANRAGALSIEGGNEMRGSAPTGLHSLRCLPCLFFRRKGDGCRKGDQCDRCHICTLQEMKRRKHKLQRQARAQAAPAAARRGPQAGPTPLRAEP